MPRFATLSAGKRVPMIPLGLLAAWFLGCVQPKPPPSIILISIDCLNQRQFEMAVEGRDLAQRLAGQGYDTAAFVGRGSISGVYGLDQGFNVFQEHRKAEGQGTWISSRRCWIW